MFNDCSNCNGGHKIYPRLVLNDENKLDQIDKYMPLYKSAKNVKIVQDAMFASTNEVRGTSYKFN